MITITKGDDATLQLTATDGNGNAVDLSGATFTTLIKGDNGLGVVSFPDSQHDVVSAPDGIFNLILTSSDTLLLGEGDNKTIITKITISDSSIYYNGFDVLTVLPNVPLQ